MRMGKGPPWFVFRVSSQKKVTAYLSSDQEYHSMVAMSVFLLKQGVDMALYTETNMCVGKK